MSLSRVPFLLCWFKGNPKGKPLIFEVSLFGDKPMCRPESSAPEDFVKSSIMGLNEFYPLLRAAIIGDLFLILWMDEILHHPRNPRRMIPL